MQDKAFVGNIVQAMQAYAEGRLGEGIPLSEVDRIFVVGSDAMMAAVARARLMQNAVQERLTWRWIAHCKEPLTLA